jgi:hypothetical protein
VESWAATVCGVLREDEPVANTVTPTTTSTSTTTAATRITQRRRRTPVAVRMRHRRPTPAGAQRVVAKAVLLEVDENSSRKERFGGIPGKELAAVFDISVGTEGALDSTKSV